MVPVSDLKNTRLNTRFLVSLVQTDEQSGLSGKAFHILEQQNRVMEEFVNQQQKKHAIPKTGAYL